MKRNPFGLFLIFIAFLSFIQAENEPFPFLTRAAIHADQFTRQYPEYDGRGVLLVILDSGVDMGIDGLQTTSTGEIKVIDVMDFSGEGDSFFQPIDTTIHNGHIVFQINDQIIYGAEQILKRIDYSSGIFGGIITEKKFVDSRFADLNGDGDDDDDFPFIVVKDTISGNWVAWLDKKGDFHLEDETPLHDYALNQEYFSFSGPGRDESSEKFNFALKLDMDARKLILHGDGVGHGTHVAGIAGGYRLYGQDGYDGIAPGVKIISCKIGDSRKSGGASTSLAMVKAFEWGIEKAKELQMPVVFNMSYGIGSELEGNAAMEEFLNSFMEQHREVVVCVSNGNSGPGLSSSGLPASSWRVIASGGLFTRENARASYGVDIKKDLIFNFSSRGGEVAKPDVIAPGSASSTVPRFRYGDRMWGTSMASPQTAGAVALLLSAITGEKLPVVNSLIKRALINSGKELDGYTFVEQGGGLIRIDKAFQIYKKLIKRVEKQLPIEFKIEVETDLQQNKTANSFFWRYGSAFDNATEPISVRVFPIYSDSKYETYESYRIKSNVQWLKVNRPKAYTRNGSQFSVDVSLDEMILQNPGLYSGKITGYRNGDFYAKENALFECGFTIIIPEKFTSKNKYKISKTAQNREPGHIDRYFVLIEPGMHHFGVEMSKKGAYTNNRFYVYDPKGRRMYVSGFVKDGSSTGIVFGPDELRPGIYEVDVFTNYSATKNTNYKIDFFASGLNTPKDTLVLHYKEGDEPGFMQTMLNEADKLTSGMLSGNINGMYRKSENRITGSDLFSTKIIIPEACDKATLKIELPEQDFLKMTDISVLVTNARGKTIINEAMNYRDITISFNVDEDRYVYLDIQPGFARESDLNSSWTAVIHQYFSFAQPMPLAFQSDYAGYGRIRLLPYNKTDLNVKILQLPTIIPEKYVYWGEIHVDESGIPFPLSIPFFIK